MRTALLSLCFFLINPLQGQNGEAILTGIALDDFTHDTLEFFIIRIESADEFDSFFVQKEFWFAEEYEFRGLQPGVYNLYCNSWGPEPKIIRNVVLEEGITIWYPRLEKPAPRRFSHYTPPYYYTDFEDEDFEVKTLGLFPNPVRDKANLSEAEIYDQVAIYDVSGTLIKTIQFELGAEMQMDLSDLEYGFYILRANASWHDFAETVKFLKL